MSNMSYCRFQNTLQDLRDCNNAMNADTFDEMDLSQDEYSAMIRLVNLCQRVIENFDRLEEMSTEFKDEEDEEEETFTRY